MVYRKAFRFVGEISPPGSFSREAKPISYPASPRSLAGNHSAVAFIPAGFAEPSASPKSPRKTASVCQLCANPCIMLMSDHATANSA